MTDEDLKKIGDEMVRVLGPVYGELDKINIRLNAIDTRLNNIDKILTEHTDKIDALMVDVLELQKKADITNDRFVGLEEKLDKFMGGTRNELNQIRDHVGLPPVIRAS